MTRKLERILIAIDESPSASAAIEQGLAIAGDEGAQVIFAHVVSIAGEHFVPGDDKPDRVPEQARTELLIKAESKAAAAADRMRDGASDRLSAEADRAARGRARRRPRRHRLAAPDGHQAVPARQYLPGVDR